MTQEEKRIKLAEAQGWRQEASGFERHGCRIVSPFGVWWHKDKSGCFSSPPDYFNDLHACHDLEQKLPRAHQTRYVQWLSALTRSSLRFYVATATAAQRAESLGLVIGLWKEGE